MKNRDRQRTNRRMKEERLNRTTEWGISDPTPRMAVDHMIDKQKAMLQAERKKVNAESWKTGNNRRIAESSTTKG